MNKRHILPRRVTAMLLTLVLCLGMIPMASAAQQNSYHDPAEHWQQASNRTNELDVNSIVTHETFYCATCRENTDFTVWRVPEYTRSGETAMNRNVKYSNGMCIDEKTVGSLGTVDCLETVRLLKANGIGVYFEKEYIPTAPYLISIPNTGHFLAILRYIL